MPFLMRGIFLARESTVLRVAQPCGEGFSALPRCQEFNRRAEFCVCGVFNADVTSRRTMAF